MGYKRVLFTEVDEFVFPEPGLYAGGLRQYIETNIATNAGNISVEAYENFHDPSEEPPLDTNRSLLIQRMYWSRSMHYDKPLLVDRAPQWNVGFHSCSNCDVTQDRHLQMLHLKCLDYGYITTKKQWKSKQSFNPKDVENNWGTQQRLTGDEWEEYYWSVNSTRVIVHIEYRQPPVF